MATNTNLYGDLTPRQAAKSAKRLLKRGQPFLVTERFGQRDPQPKRGSLVRKFRRYESLATLSAPLAEAVTPKGQKLSCTDISATLQQWGGLVEWSDVVDLTHEDNIPGVAMDLCGEQAGRTLEEMRISILRAGTNVFYANSAATRVALASPPLRGDLRRIVRSFRRNNAEEISEIIQASPLISTTPVAPAFFALGHTDLESDLRGLSGFTPVEQYSDAMKALPSEIGKCESIRFILTNMFEPWLAAATTASTQTTYLTNGAAGTGSADVYPIIILAKNAYGIVPLQGEEAVTPIFMNPKPDKSDPLGQKGYAAWKTWQTCVILNELWMARYEVNCTATPS